MKSDLTLSMIGWQALVVIRNGIGAKCRLLKKGESAPSRVARIVTKVELEDLGHSVDGFSHMVLEPAVALMLKEAISPGKDIVFARPELREAGFGGEQIIALDEDLGVALRATLKRNQGGGFDLEIWCWYEHVERVPYRVAYKLVPVDPLDWSPEDRGLQMVIGEDLVAGVAVLARPVSNLDK